MKNLLLILVLFSLFSCEFETRSEKEIVTKSVEPETEKAIKRAETPFLNPHLIYGSSFGELFQALYRQGDFDQMMVFTHKESIKKHSREDIEKHYKDMKFNFKLDLHSSKKINDTTYVLNYTSNIIATRTIIRMTVGIENDSAKVILPDKLKQFP